jgi:hypothetical protein
VVNGEWAIWKSEIGPAQRREKIKSLNHLI